MNAVQHTPSINNLTYARIGNESSIRKNFTFHNGIFPMHRDVRKGIASDESSSHSNLTALSWQIIIIHNDVPPFTLFMRK